MAVAGAGGEVEGDEGGLAFLGVGEALDDGVGEVGVADEDGVEVVAEEGFDGGGVFVGDLEARGEDAEDAGLEEGGVVEAVEDGFGSGFVAFAFFDDGAEGVEAGLGLGEAGLGVLEFLAGGFVLALGVLVGVVGAFLEGFHLVHAGEGAGDLVVEVFFLLAGGFEFGGELLLFGGRVFRRAGGGLRRGRWRTRSCPGWWRGGRGSRRPGGGRRGVFPGGRRVRR